MDSATSNGQDQLKHVIHIMLENRGFDHLLGWLYQGNGDFPAVYVGGSGDPVKFYGIADDFLSQQGLTKSELTNTVSDDEGNPLFSNAPSDITDPPLLGPCTPSIDPFEEFDHVNTQLFNSGAASGTPSMTGFMQDFAGRFGSSSSDWTSYQKRISSIMHCFSPADLPVLNSLAKAYAVSDQWFSSVPTQTNANRGFSLAGHSISNVSGSPIAIVNNSGKTAQDTFSTEGLADFNVNSIFDILSNNQVDWKTYYQVKYPIPEMPGLSNVDEAEAAALITLLALLFPEIVIPVGASVATIIAILEQKTNNENCYTENSFLDASSSGFNDWAQLLTDISNKNLSTFSYLEPAWTLELQLKVKESGLGSDLIDLIEKIFNQSQQDSAGFAGNDYHPPVDMVASEDMLQTLYQALMDSGLANETLLVITFDEHGGTYDHVKPPANATPPWGNTVPTGLKLQEQFQFDRFGVRVPALFISPWISKKTVVRSSSAVPFDHTSVLSTLLSWQGIPYQQPTDSGYMGERVAIAPTFLSVLNSNTARTDNIFEDGLTPSIGDPVNIGDVFMLKNQNDQYITSAYSGVSYYFPQNGSLSDAVNLSFYGGSGQVSSSQEVRIRTTEALNTSDIAKYDDSKKLGPYVYSSPANMLGAWRDETDCYYYQSIDNDEELWNITPTDGSTMITYGMEVKITSASEKYKGEVLEVYGSYISTTSKSGDTWTVIPVKQPIATL